MNDDPKWDELEQYIRGWAKDTAAKVHDELKNEAEHQARLLQIRETHNELKLQFAPQVEEDIWPDVIGDE